MSMNIQDVEKLLIKIVKPITDKLEQMENKLNIIESIYYRQTKELEILERYNTDLIYLREQFKKIQADTFEIVTQQVSPILQPTQQNQQQVPSPPQFQWAPLPQAPLPQAIIAQDSLQQAIIPHLPNYEDQVVYKTAKGQKYHKIDCDHKKSFRSQLTLAKAEQIGLEPCQNCHKQNVRF